MMSGKLIAWKNLLMPKREMSLAKKRKFMNAACEEFLDVVRGAEDQTTDFASMPQWHIDSYFEHWFSKLVFEYRRDWGNNVRLVQALLDGFRSGALVVSDRDHVDELKFIVSSYADNLSQVVEYYVQTGELLELVSCFRDSERISLSIIHNEFDALLRMYHFYCYDVSRVHELLAEDGDVSGHMNLPLEVRMGLSDCWDDVPEHFSDTDFSIDHTKVLPADVFENLRR